MGVCEMPPFILIIILIDRWIVRWMDGSCVMFLFFFFLFPYLFAKEQVEAFPVLHAPPP